MKHQIRLAVFFATILLLFLSRSFWALPKLPPEGALGVCTACHWDKRGLPAHQGVDFAAGDCLRCHNPHTHFGRPYLPSIDSCLICHFEYKARPGWFVHRPVRQKQCTSCHTPHKLFEKSRLVTDLSMLCNVCHRDEMLLYEEPVGHMPYEKRQCLSCHEAHMAKERALLRTPLAMLCNSCHRQEEEWARPLQHLPFERGKCLDCHLPHASAWPGLTKQGQVVLCYSCHYDRKGELKRPVKHDPYGRGRCTDCHEPHSAAAANLLPTASEEEFCLSCHQKIIDVGWHGSPHARLFDERTCLACHEHHAAGFRYLSRFPLDGRGNLCLFCHDRIGRYYYLSAHAFLRCGQCHQIHGSLYPHLLDAFELDLCNRCHTGMVHRSTNHPVGEPYRDQLRGRVLLCSSCHGPHGTRYAKMKLRHGNDLCLPCHDQIY